MKVDPSVMDDESGPYWLTQAMARTVGVSITDEIARGRISRADLAEMVVHCAACEKTEGCLLWLAQGGGDSSDVPAYCLNHERIEALLWTTGGAD